MAKRKRASNSPSPAPSSSPDPSDRALKQQKRVCNRCLLDAKKNLVAALRVGAGFERQKHSRRKKTAQAKKDTKGLARLEAEYAVLKGLEMEKVAEQHLRKTVGKVKSLKDQEALKTYVEGVEKGSADPATLNVLARLYKVAAVKKVVDEVVEDLKKVFVERDGASQKEESGKKRKKDEDGKKRKKEVNGDVEMLDPSDEEGDPFEVFNSRIAAPSSGEESEGSVSDGERPPSIGESESEHDPEDDLQADSESEEADSFAGFSDEEDEEASDDDMAIDRRIAPPSDESASESDVSMPTTKAKSKSKAAETKHTSSAFLPGLSHAAYIAGSDSDASDLSASFAPRKNRRGQRARQKIAEAKFGAKAKHLEKADRNKGWDPKRGAVDTQKRGYGPQQSGENAVPLGKKRGEGSKRDDKGDLHPSWQAAKAAKEKKMVKIEVGKPGQGMGKKVVFD